MSWKCPECGKANEARECPCGYAYYKILQTRPDDPAATVQQAVDYLLQIWKVKASKGDHISRQRATARLKHIQAAYNVYRQLAPQKEAAATAALPKKTVIMAAAGAGVLLVVVLAVVFLTGGKPTEQPAPPPPAAQTGQPAAPQPPPAAGQDAGQQPADQGAVPPPPPPAMDSSVEKNEQWAVDEVKKSRVLDKFMTVDDVAKKWAEKRPTWKALGWQAKKMEGDVYLVSYLLSDGLNMDGMYFDISAATGAVRHLADHPELQEKYGIRYKK